MSGTHDCRQRQGQLWRKGWHHAAGLATLHKQVGAGHAPSGARRGAQARREAGKFDLSADAGACVLKLGTSTDLGFCAARKKARRAAARSAI